MIKNFDDVLFKLKTENGLDIHDVIEGLSSEEVNNLKTVIDGWFRTKADDLAAIFDEYFGISHLSVTICLNVCKNNLHIAYEVAMGSADDYYVRDELIKALLKELKWPTFWPTWGDPEEYRVQWYRDFGLYINRLGFDFNWKRFEK